MAFTLAGFPFWQLSFNKDGAPVDSAALVQFRNEIKAMKISDFFIFSHGWNNDQQTAQRLYQGFFGQMRSIIDQSNLPAGVTIGTAGVFWPSIQWPESQTADAGGAASLAGDEIDLGSEMKKVFQESPQQQSVDRLMNHLETQTPTDGAITAFIADLRNLLQPQSPSPEFLDLEKRAAAATTEQWRQMLDLLADTEAQDASSGGAADLGDVFPRLWRGAKAALRVVTYWQMKARAGVVGKSGLAPLLNQVASDVPTIRIHLLGHSFGARLVSYTLTGLQIGANGASPVKSLFLIQGAFSHFAFAEALPFDRTRKGDLAGMNARVDGPLITTFSAFDKAVGFAYPAASVLANDDASAAEDLMYRWEGMGCDGAQAVNAAISVLGDPPCAYVLRKGEWLNLDGNSVITQGGQPAGAHSDIIHPQIAWAALKAAAIV
jgi:hypothetical protein